MNECNNYTVYAESAAELAHAADRIDKSMDRAIGRNEIRYCLNNGRQVGYDTGFITDGALDELRRDFVIVQDTARADQ